MKVRNAAGRSTVAVHGAGGPGNAIIGRPLSEPLVRSTTFALPSAETHAALYRSRKDGFYQRFGHPTISAAAQRIADLEGAERSLMFGSGMGAIATTLLSLLHAGDHAVVHREVFAQTGALLQYLIDASGVTVSFVDARQPKEVQAAMRETTRLIYVETPSNPLLHVLDVSALGQIARRRGCDLAVDSTFASPILQVPLALGATLSLHSGTKFLGGHSDVMCGFVSGSTSRLDAIREMQVLLGTVSDPEAAWLVLRSCATLPLRVERAAASALSVAEFLAADKRIVRVSFPWLVGDPGYEIAKRQMRGGGAVVSFEPAGGVAASRRLLNNLRLISIATSLGGAESVAELPYDLDFRDEEIAADRDKSPALVRISIGLEETVDLIDDLKQAMSGL